MRALGVAGTAALAGASVGAGPLRVHGIGSVQGVMERLAEDLGRQVGTPFDFTFGTAGVIRDKVQAGEPADVVVATDVAIDQLATAGKVFTGSRTILGHSGLAVAIREGGRAPHEALQNYTTYVGAIPHISADPAAARAFLRALTSPDDRARLQASGFSATETP